MNSWETNHPKAQSHNPSRFLHGTFAIGMPTGISSDLARAIVRHRAADQAFIDNCWRSDTLDPRYASDTPGNNASIYRATLQAETDALYAVLSMPAPTCEDSTAKSKHLLNYWRRQGLEARHFEPLLRAMIFDF